MKRLLLMLVFALLTTMTLYASTITFPSSNHTFTENDHNFTISGEGNVWNSDYQSASYCAGCNTSYGSIILTKTSGNPFQLNNLWIKGAWGGFQLTVKGYNGSSQLYTTGTISVSSSYAQTTLSSWTGINKIVVTAISNGSFNIDDIDYTVTNTAPTNISLSSSSVDDGNPSGTTVGTFSSTDADDSGAHTYTFASGGTDNSSFTIDGSSLSTAFTADYDTKNSYAIKIRSTDSGSLWYEKDFTISVNSATPSCYIVSDAEYSGYNGTYNRDGNYNGSPQYSKGSISLVYKDCYTQWALVDGDPDLACPGFSTETAGSLPPSSGWVQGGWNGPSSKLVITNGDASLPVELSAFSAVTENGTILLTWSTQSETDHLGFVIQRQTIVNNKSESDWQDVASYLNDESLQSYGNTTNTRNYQYRDKDVTKENQYKYRLKSVAIDGSVDYSRTITIDSGLNVPSQYMLYPAFPNPFNPITTINFDLEETGDISLTVTDITGKHVRTLLQQLMSAGQHSAHWDGIDHQGIRAASGVYFITLKTGNGLQLSQKVLLLK